MPEWMVKGGVLVLSVLAGMGSFFSFQSHKAREADRMSQWEQGHADEYKVVSGTRDNQEANQGKTVYVQVIASIDY